MGIENVIPTFADGTRKFSAEDFLKDVNGLPKYGRIRHSQMVMDEITRTYIQIEKLEGDTNNIEKREHLRQYSAALMDDYEKRMRVKWDDTDENQSDSSEIGSLFFFLLILIAPLALVVFL